MVGAAGSVGVGVAVAPAVGISGAAASSSAPMAAPTTSSPVAVAPASSTVVSLGTDVGSLLFGTGSVGSVGAYSAVQAMNSTSSDVNYLSARTGLSIDFVNGFISGLYANTPTLNSSLEKLGDAMILALLLELLERRRS